MNDTQLLPADLAACQAIIVEQRQKISELRTTRPSSRRGRSPSLHQKVQEQELTINELLQRAFRNRSERYREDPDQLKLDFGNTPEAADAAEGLAAAVEEAEEIIVKEHKRRRHKPRKARDESFPAHLPRYEVTLRSARGSEALRQHGERKLIGYDRQETLEFERPKLKVRVTRDSQVRLRRPAGSAA